MAISADNDDFVMPLLRRADGAPATVLQVLPSLVAGGVEKGTLDMAEALLSAEAVPLIASSGGPLVKELKRMGAEHITLPLNSRNPLVIQANKGRLRNLILQRGVDILHARSRAPAWSARSAAKGTRCRFVTTFHARYNFRSFIKRQYNAVMASGERVIAISDSLADHISQHYKINPPRLVTIHRGVDLRHFHPDRVSAERMVRLATDWRLPEDRPVIMLPGRLTRLKGHAELLKALAKLSTLPDAPAFVCLLVGSDQGRTAYRREMEALITRLGLAASTFVVDHCRDMAAAYMLADVVVSASLQPEGFGRVVAEAQAMGRPVVVSRHGGALEQIVEGETGFSYQPGKIDELAKALLEALTLTPQARESLHRQAMARVNALYSKTVMCRRTIELYQDLLDNPTARS